MTVDNSISSETTLCAQLNGFERDASDAGDELDEVALPLRAGLAEEIMQVGPYRAFGNAEHFGHRLDAVDVQHRIEHAHLAGGQLVKPGDRFQRRRRVRRGVAD